MILKLIDQKVEVELMKVPELVKETSIHYVFEPNTEHLHPVLTVNGLDFKGDHIVINIPENGNELIVLTVTLYDDNNHIVHIYHGELAYNKYQITGTKPIRPDFERYIHELENNILTLKEEKVSLILEYEARIKEIEEKGEVV